MKVIGSGAGGCYLCEVQHTELEKFMNLYYGNLKRLNVGESIDLGAGFNHAEKIADAMRKTKEFVEANQTVVTAILNGLNYAKIQADSQAKPGVDHGT